MSVAVTTPVFEGPFDLLLHLILQEEVDLWEVSLATIVDTYLVELDRMEGLDLETATEFLLIAATLVELKARRLLPAPEEVELDEDLLRFEERDLLLGRLLECKTFKDVARAFEALARSAARSLPRSAGPEEPYRSMAPDPLAACTPERLAAAARAALVPRPSPVVDTEHLAPIRVSVREAVDVVLARLPERASLSFRELVAGIEERLEVVVRFLAVLELFKQGVVEMDQAFSFGELRVRRLDVGAQELDARSIDDWEDDADLAADAEAAEAADVAAPERVRVG